MGNFISTYQHEIQNAKNRLLSDSQLITTSAGLIEVGMIGKGSPILISHGSGGGYDMGLWLGALINGPYQYIAPSRFGYLRSPVTTLVIHAVNDPIVPIASGEFTANTIPHAQFLQLEDGGHFVCVTHREKTIPVIQNFLTSIAD